MSFSYREVTVSLATATTTGPQQISGIDPGTPIVSVLALVVGTVQGFIRVGATNNDPLPIVNSLSIKADPCDPIIGGIFLDNPVAQPGVSFALVVTYGSIIPSRHQPMVELP